ncbi:unnamed protein product [Thelazia callipaeda]|uniref:G_PROTEIN_RECEP_F1_2 domain-containing protein n=1 Tax=Thelazia callipaeda TaxID=103827 RepID=A0A0N5D5U7_THECL|nr:unnamed protein product [Thelazia callipaeda]
MPPTQGALIFGTIFIISGIFAMVFNATIIMALCRMRRSILSRIFYILILNFALIDLLKSICLIVWALKMLPTSISSSMYFMKADQLALMILRFSNLATILNLLMITLNEYAYIVYPFHYRQFVTNARTIILIIACWLIAWGFTLSILLIRSRKQSIYIKPDCLVQQKQFACFVRTGQTSTEMEYVYNIVIIVFCFVCLVIAIVCYSALIRVISKIIRTDTSLLHLEELNRTKRQLLRRNKYVIVIGSVLSIYIVYLISYSAIKFLFVSRLKRYII